jgi:hypothetical protein
MTPTDVIIALQDRHQINLKAIGFLREIGPKLRPCKFRANEWNYHEWRGAKLQNQELSSTQDQLRTTSVLRSTREALSPKKDL